MTDKSEQLRQLGVGIMKLTFMTMKGDMVRVFSEGKEETWGSENVPTRELYGHSEHPMPSCSRWRVFRPLVIGQSNDDVTINTSDMLYQRWSY